MRKVCFFVCLTMAVIFAGTGCSDRGGVQPSPGPDIDIGNIGKLGGPCSEEGLCDEGLECNARHICINKPVVVGEGEACGGYKICGEGLVCGADGICAKEEGPPVSAACYEDGTCIKGIIQPPLKELPKLQHTVEDRSEPREVERFFDGVVDSHPKIPPAGGLPANLGKKGGQCKVDVSTGVTSCDEGFQCSIDIANTADELKNSTCRDTHLVAYEKTYIGGNMMFFSPAGVKDFEVDFLAPIKKLKDDNKCFVSNECIPEELNNCETLFNSCKENNRNCRNYFTDKTVRQCTSCLIKTRNCELKEIGFTHAGVVPIKNPLSEPVKLNLYKAFIQEIRDAGLNVFYESIPQFYHLSSSSVESEKYDSGIEKRYFNAAGFDPWFSPQNDISAFECNMTSACEKKDDQTLVCSKRQTMCLNGAFICHDQKGCGIDSGRPCCEYICQISDGKYEGKIEWSSANCVYNTANRKKYPAVPFNNTMRALDPSYTGQLWQDTLKMLADEAEATLKGKNDWIGFDFETYGATSGIDGSYVHAPLPIFNIRTFEYDSTGKEILRKKSVIAASEPYNTYWQEDNIHPYVTYVSEWKKRGFELRQVVKNLFPDNAPLITFYLENPKVKNDYNGYRYVPNAEAGGAVFYPKVFIGEAAVTVRLNVDIRKPDGYMGSTFYMPTGVGDVPNPVFYNFNSLEAIDAKLNNGADYTGSVAWISFDWSSIGNKNDPNVIRYLGNEPYDMKIEYPEYAQMIGFKMNRAGIKGVVIYGEGPFNLMSYTWNEWKTIVSAFNKGFINGENPNCLNDGSSNCKDDPAKQRLSYGYVIQDKVLKIIKK